MGKKGGGGGDRPCESKNSVQEMVTCLGKEIDRLPRMGAEELDGEQALEDFRAAVGEDSSLWQINDYYFTDNLRQEIGDHEIGMLHYYFTGAKRIDETHFVLMAETGGIYPQGQRGRKARMYVWVETFENEDSNYTGVMIRPH